MSLVQEAWDIVKHQLDDSHEIQDPLEFHFRVHKCLRAEAGGEDDKFFKYNGSPVRQSIPTRYDKLENEINVDPANLKRQ